MTRIYVLATAKMQGIDRGQVRPVSSESEWVKDNLRTGLLAQVNRDGSPVAATVAAPDGAAEEPVEAAAAETDADADAVPVEDRGDDVSVSEGDHDDIGQTEDAVPSDAP